MRGKYHMMDWEEQKWVQQLTVAIAELTRNKSKTIDFTNDDVCPANIVSTLEKMGWEWDEQDDNGWQNDCWLYFSHHDYDFVLTLHYCGYTFEINLYRSDCND